MCPHLVVRRGSRVFGAVATNSRKQHPSAPERFHSPEPAGLRYRRSWAEPSSGSKPNRASGRILELDVVRIVRRLTLRRVPLRGLRARSSAQPNAGDFFRRMTANARFIQHRLSAVEREPAHRLPEIARSAVEYRIQRYRQLAAAAQKAKVRPSNPMFRSNGSLLEAGFSAAVGPAQLRASSGRRSSFPGRTTP